MSTLAERYAQFQQANLAAQQQAIQTGQQQQLTSSKDVSGNVSFSSSPTGAPAAPPAGSTPPPIGSIGRGGGGSGGGSSSGANNNPLSKLADEVQSKQAQQSAQEEQRRVQQRAARETAAQAEKAATERQRVADAYSVFQQANLAAQQQALATGRPVNLKAGRNPQDELQKFGSLSAREAREQFADYAARNPRQIYVNPVTGERVMNPFDFIAKQQSANEAARRQGIAAYAADKRRMEGEARELGYSVKWSRSSDGRLLNQAEYVPIAGQHQYEYVRPDPTNPFKVQKRDLDDLTARQSLVRDVDNPTPGFFGPAIDAAKGARAEAENLVANLSYGLTGVGAILSERKVPRRTLDSEGREISSNLPRPPQLQAGIGSDLSGLGMTAAFQLATTGKTDVQAGELQKVGENILKNPWYGLGNIGFEALTFFGPGVATKGARAVQAAKTAADVQKSLSPLGNIVKVEKDLVNIGTESDPYRYAVGRYAKVEGQPGVSFFTRQLVTSQKELLQPPSRLTVYTRPAVTIGERGSEQVIDVSKLPKKLPADSPIQEFGGEYYERFEAIPGRGDVNVKVQVVEKGVSSSEGWTVKEIQEALSTEKGIKEFLGTGEQVGFRPGASGGVGGGAGPTATKTLDSVRKIIDREKQAAKSAGTFLGGAAMAASNTFGGFGYAAAETATEQQFGLTFDVRPEAGGRGPPTMDQIFNNRVQDSLAKLVERPGQVGGEARKASERMLDALTAVQNTKGRERQRAVQVLIGNIALTGESDLDRALRKNTLELIISQQGLGQLRTPTEVSEKFLKQSFNFGVSRDTGTLIRQQDLQTTLQTPLFRFQQQLVPRFDVPNRPTPERIVRPPDFTFWPTVETPGKYAQRSRMDRTDYFEREWQIPDVLTLAYGKKAAKKLPGFGRDDYGDFVRAFLPGAKKGRSKRRS
ncbi:hypothetical protein [Nitrososphaera viennensis]|nr:hypothetical protein [Nitrososphaera viennensis]UVS69074.1 hypothetical protein NWT39_14350 [Nitrososphaera viennensis]